MSAPLPWGLNVDAARYNARLTGTRWYVCQRGAVQVVLEEGSPRLADPKTVVLWSTASAEGVSQTDTLTSDPS